VRAKAFRKPRSLSHGTCDSKLGTKLNVDASCSESQGTSHLNENGNLSSQTAPPDRPLYHCSFCGKDGYQESFYYRHARYMRRARASRPLVVHSPSHSMNTCEPKKLHFIDGFYDCFSSELDHVRGHASSASCVGPRYASRDACVGSSLKPSGDHCLFAIASTRSSSRVALSRHGSKDVLKTSHLNRHLHHPNPHDKLSAYFTRMAKSWVSKFMFANPSGSKSRTCLSSHV